MLADALRAAAPAPGARVLDFCTGTGFLAVAAARAGAGAVTALDIAARAVVLARLNGAVRRIPITAVRGGVAEAARRGPFDVVVSNPPYVPHPGGRVDRRWDAGADGRLVLDPLCALLPSLLAPGGFALLVQSRLAGEEATATRLRAGGLSTTVVARRRIPFGPVLRGRLGYLRRCGVLAPDATAEEVVVIRADRRS